jgi:hypothetical protein
VAGLGDRAQGGYLAVVQRSDRPIGRVAETEADQTTEAMERAGRRGAGGEKPGVGNLGKFLVLPLA